MLLDCSSYESTKLSLANIFNTTEERLVSALKPLRPFESICQPPEDILYDNVCDIFGAPRDDINILWFHGTRTDNENLFYEHGILNKSKARRYIEPLLISMSKGLKSSGCNPFSVSLSGKQGIHDEGPFAFLIREVAIQAPVPCHGYLDAPEMVEDIAGTLLGENYLQLVDRFKKITSPYVVSFISE